jgi:hypothetical protein
MMNGGLKPSKSFNLRVSELNKLVQALEHKTRKNILFMVPLAFFGKLEKEMKLDKNYESTLVQEKEFHYLLRISLNLLDLLRLLLS